MSRLILLRKRVVKSAKICKDCKRIIDGHFIKGMKCAICGKSICYKCNLAYKCNDCYIKSRNEYYINTPFQDV